jgi:hypothetical protein
MFVRLSKPLLFVVLTLAASACLGGHRIEQALAPGFPDLRLADMVEVRDAKNQVLVSGKFATKSETPTEIVRTALLTNPANDDWEGVAEIRVERDSNNMMKEDEIIVSVDDLPDDTACALLFDGLKVSDFATDGDGAAEVHLRRDSLARRYN